MATELNEKGAEEALLRPDQKSKGLEKEEDDPRDHLCGIGSWTPKWLQKFASSKCYMTVYGCLGAVQAMAFVYFLSTLNTIEKRFGIQSKTTGWMLSGNEVSQVFLALVLSFYGGHGNRPLWIGMGVAFSGLSCFILASPHFIFGSGATSLALTEEYQEAFSHVNTSLPMVKKSVPGLCRRERDEALEVCDDGSNEDVVAPLLIFFSQFVLGIGTTLYYSLGQVYLDDSSKKANTPMLLGSSMSLRMMGTVFSFALIYFCLSTYVNPFLTPTISQNDPRWVGAWWLGWVLLGSVMILQAFLIVLFPKKMLKNPEVEKPMALEEKPDTKVESNGTGKFYIGEEKKKSEKEFWPSLFRLLKNKILLANILAGCFYILGGSGYMTFMTKNMEVQFYQTSANANVLIGPIILTSMVTGFLLSGYVISKWKPRPVILFGWNVVVGLVFVASELSYIWLACPDTEIVGYNPETKSFNMMNDCNAGCGCESAKFSPVYLQERLLTFYSPCHAGCMEQVKDNKLNAYKNCSCIPSLKPTNASSFYGNSSVPYEYEPPSAFVRDGYNQVGCTQIYTIYLILNFVKNFLGSTGKIGNILVNHRSVDPEDKPFAQGVALVFVSLFAFIPGPIIFGYILDGTCIIWDTTCGRKGSCWFYDRFSFRLYLNCFSALFTFIATILDGFVCYYGRNLVLYDKEDETEKELQEEKKAS